MTYDNLQRAFGAKYAIFSAFAPGDETNTKWKAENAFKDDIPDRVVNDLCDGTLSYQGWGKKAYQEHFEGPLTWKMIMSFFDRAIVKTDDFHHVFLEDIIIKDYDAGLIELVAGS